VELHPRAPLILPALPNTVPHPPATAPHRQATVPHPPVTARHRPSTAQLHQHTVQRLQNTALPHRSTRLAPPNTLPQVLSIAQAHLNTAPPLLHIAQHPPAIVPHPQAIARRHQLIHPLLVLVAVLVVAQPGTVLQVRPTVRLRLLTIRMTTKNKTRSEVSRTAGRSRRKSKTQLEKLTTMRNVYVFSHPIVIRSIKYVKEEDSFIKNVSPLYFNNRYRFVVYACV